jgi:hypothetical protein
MPWSDDGAVRMLRLSYNAAVSAHADCARKLTEATIRGESPSTILVQAEASARAGMNSAREKLHAAMAASMAPSRDE